MDKIDLENLIYLCAVKYGRKMQSKNGRLFCPDAPAVLRGLVYLYNGNFFRENRRFLQEDMKMERRETRLFWNCCLAERKEMPLFKSFHLDVFKD